MNYLSLNLVILFINDKAGRVVRVNLRFAEKNTEQAVYSNSLVYLSLSYITRSPSG